MNGPARVEQYGDNRDRRSRGYADKRGRRGVSTATRERGEAEAKQINGAAREGRYGDNREEKQWLYR